MGGSTNNVVPLKVGKADFAGQISTAATELELIEACTRTSSAYGYKYFSILRLPMHDDRNLADLDVISNWPEKLIREYDAHGLLENSPVIKHLTISTEPLVFDMGEINRDRSQSEKFNALNIFEEHGIRNGVFFSVHMANGKVGGVSFTGDRDALTETDMLELNYLASLIYTRINVLKSEIADGKHQLSSYELEVLTMLSQGKTAANIAAEKSISEHAVNIYLNNLCRKLDCTTVVQAVSKAFRLRIIS